MNWKKIVSLFGTAAIFSLVCPIQAAAITGPSGDLTQREYLELLAKASARKTSLPANPTAADYVKWAVARGIMPEGGWQPDAPLTRQVYARTLAQLYGMSAQVDPVRALKAEGVMVPATNLVSRTTVVDELSDFGFRSVTAQYASHPATPIQPPPKVILCHNGHTLVVAQSGADSHLAKGDYLGSCTLR